MSPRVDHKKPAIAFLAIVVVTAAIIGNAFRADALLDPFGGDIPFALGAPMAPGTVLVPIDPARLEKARVAPAPEPTAPEPTAPVSGETEPDPADDGDSVVQEIAGVLRTVAETTLAKAETAAGGASDSARGAGRDRPAARAFASASAAGRGSYHGQSDRAAAKAAKRSAKAAEKAGSWSAKAAKRAKVREPHRPTHPIRLRALRGQHRH